MQVSNPCLIFAPACSSPFHIASILGKGSRRERCAHCGTTKPTHYRAIPTALAVELQHPSQQIYGACFKTKFRTVKALKVEDGPRAAAKRRRLGVSPERGSACKGQPTRAVRLEVDADRTLPDLEGPLTRRGSGSCFRIFSGPAAGVAGAESTCEPGSIADQHPSGSSIAEEPAGAVFGRLVQLLPGLLPPGRCRDHPGTTQGAWWVLTTVAACRPIVPFLQAEVAAYQKRRWTGRQGTMERQGGGGARLEAGLRVEGAGRSSQAARSTGRGCCSHTRGPWQG